MLVSEQVQRKVVEISSDESISAKGKNYAKSRFYELKKEEVDLDQKVEDFKEKVKEFENELDAALEKMSKSKVDVVTPLPKSQVQRTSVANKAREMLIEEETDVDEEPYEVTETN